MTLHSRRLSHSNAKKFSQWTLALALGACASVPAHAANVGHSRVVSNPGAPLRIVVPLDNLTPEDRASLKVTLANAAAWERAGMQPPVPLDSLRVSVQDGRQANSKSVRIESSQPLTTSTVDVLLDLQSSAGRRQVQVTLLVPQRADAVPVQSARVGDRTASNTTRAAATTTVRAGDSLFRIARRNAVSDADIYQMLVAIWRANPQAFIQNNMHLVRAGEKLNIPDAATVRAVNATEARRIYLEHEEAFARYRGRAAAQVAGAVAAGAGSNAGVGQVSAAPVESATSVAPAQDRVRLSASDSPEAQADARTSEQRALQYAEQRVQALQGNVDALSQVAGGQPTGGESSGVAGAVEQGTAATGGAASEANSRTLGAGAGAGAQALGTENAGAAAGSSASSAPGINAGSAGSSGSAAADGANVPASPTQAPLSNSSAAEAPASTGNWFADNLLIIVTAGLAFMVLIVAWLLRRAGARRADDNEDSGDYVESTLDTGVFARKLEGIDLDLSKPPSDEPTKREPRV